MTWTYALTQPQSTKDMIRFLITDTDASDPLLDDEGIASLIALECGSPTGSVNVYRVAAQACDVIAGAFGRQGDQSDAAILASNRSRAADYRAAAKSFRDRARREGAAPYVSGISISDKQTVEADRDRVQPAFAIGMLDAPGTVTFNPLTLAQVP